MIYDITRTVSTGTPVWPGDNPFDTSVTLSLEAGHAVNLLRFNMTAHVGTHIDAYYHYQADGPHPATMPLDAYIGRARVVTVSRQDGPINLEDLAHVDLAGGERLIIHTPMSERSMDQFHEQFPYASVDLIAALAGMGYRLIGVDSPSFDSFDSKDLPGHHALAQYGLVNIENLALAGVPDGDYELIALPLKFDEICGSPVRAILRSLD